MVSLKAYCKISVYFGMILLSFKTKAKVSGIHVAFWMIYNLSYLGSKTKEERNLYQRINLEPEAW